MSLIFEAYYRNFATVEELVSLLSARSFKAARAQFIVLASELLNEFHTTEAQHTACSATTAPAAGQSAVVVKKEQEECMEH